MNLLFSLLLSLFFTQPNRAYSPMQNAKIDTVKIVSSIKTQYLAIDAKRKVFSLYTPKVKVAGTSFMGYLDGNNPRIIQVGSYTDTLKLEADEYLDETGNVIMIYAKQSVYETPLSLNSRSPVKATTDSWFYFHNKVLIKMVSGGKVIPAGSEQFKRMSEYYNTELPKHKKLFADMSGVEKIR